MISKIENIYHEKKTAMKIVHVQGQNDTAMKRVNKYFGIKSECHGQNGNG